MLGLSLEKVRVYWRQSCVAQSALTRKRVRAPRSEGKMGFVVSAPKSKGDFAALRERVGLALWETVLVTFAVPEGTVAASMLAVRVRALRQMAKLYGMGGKRSLRFKVSSY